MSIELLHLQIILADHWWQLMLKRQVPKYSLKLLEDCVKTPPLHIDDVWQLIFQLLHWFAIDLDKLFEFVDILSTQLRWFQAQCLVFARADCLDHSMTLLQRNLALVHDGVDYFGARDHHFELQFGQVAEMLANIEGYVEDFAFIDNCLHLVLMPLFVFVLLRTLHHLRLLVLNNVEACLNLLVWEWALRQCSLKYFRKREAFLRRIQLTVQHHFVHSSFMQGNVPCIVFQCVVLEAEHQA